MKQKTIFSFFILLFLPTFLVAIFVVCVDPFFHYHAPLRGIPYTLSDERYQNDGILKHFDYEAVITGTSLTQNFKASDVDRLWGYKTVKTSFAGGSFKETGDAIGTALSYNKNIKAVFRDLNPNLINADKDSMTYTDYPKYLYDRNPFNDYDYLFNEDVLIAGIRNILRFIRHGTSTSFDEYSNWNDYKSFGKEAVLASFTRLEKNKYIADPLNDSDYKRIEENLVQNVIMLAKESPNTEFYIFIPPGSVVFWDALIIQGAFDNTMNMYEFAFDKLLEADNIRLYAFDDRIDITGNLDNYMDSQHYSEAINSYLLECMYYGDGLMTRDNFKDYLERVREIYNDYDYESIYR